MDLTISSPDTAERVTNAVPVLFLNVLADSFLPYLTSSNINCKVEWLAVIEFVLCADVPC